MKTLSFKVETIVLFLPAIIGELVRLLAEVDSLETKRHILSSLNVLIEQSKGQVSLWLPCLKAGFLTKQYRFYPLHK